MKFSSYFAVAILVGVVLSSPARADVALVGVYDPVDDNDVDDSGTFLSATGSASALNVLDLATFRPLVAGAFTAGTGGVISFEVGDEVTGVTGDNSLTTDPFGGAQLNFTAATGNHLIGFGDGSDDRLPTSGQTATTDGGRLGQNSGSDFDLTNFAFTGAPANTGITALGATLIHRRNTRSWDATATFSDGSTLLFAPVDFAPVNPVTGERDPTIPGVNSLDTFFGVQAPDGTTITSLVINNIEGGGNSWLDDIGFVSAVVAIPEPSSLTLGILATGIAAVRRRRK